MHTVRITDDLSRRDAPTIKMVCACGWIEKAFADRDGLARAETHIRNRHTTGMIHYKGHTINITGGR